MPDNSTRCRPQTLASQGPVRIDLCGCGQVHLSISALTVRLSPAVARLLGEALRTALARIELPPATALPLH